MKELVHTDSINHVIDIQVHKGSKHMEMVDHRSIVSWKILTSLQLHCDNYSTKMSNYMEMNTHILHSGKTGNVYTATTF